MLNIGGVIHIQSWGVQEVIDGWLKTFGGAV
jgi:hypothetical protein